MFKIVSVSDKAAITPLVLKWARTSANITMEKAASTIGSTVERVRSWEEGHDKPTIKQAEKLAHLYRRPFAVLFLPRVPHDFTVLKDFRTTRKGEFSTALIFMMREAQEKQEWVRGAFEDAGEEILPFVGKFNHAASVENVARDIRSTLGIVTNELNGKALRYWIQKAEKVRVYKS